MDISPENYTDPISTRHTTVKLDEGSALVVFESSQDLDAKTVPRIKRFYYEDNCYGQTNEGSSLAYGLSLSCLLYIRCRPGDLVAISERLKAAPLPVWRYFRIGENFEINPLSWANRKLNYEEIHNELKRDGIDSKPTKIEKRDISKVFAKKCPPWLCEILDRQLLHWHRQNPPIYYEHTRNLQSDDEVQRCVEVAPFIALARWKERLSKAQLCRAIHGSPAAAVRYAIDNIPCQLRAEYFRKNPSAALEQHSKLSNAELHICSQEDPRNALLIRSMLRPEQAAIILANCFTSFLDDITFSHLDTFKTEVVNSITEFPMVWVSVYAKRFEQLVVNLDLIFSYKLDSATLKTFLNNVEFPQKLSVAEYIAANV